MALLGIVKEHCFAVEFARAPPSKLQIEKETGDELSEADGDSGEENMKGRRNYPPTFGRQDRESQKERQVI